MTAESKAQAIELHRHGVEARARGELRAAAVAFEHSLRLDGASRAAVVDLQLTMATLAESVAEIAPTDAPVATVRYLDLLERCLTGMLYADPSDDPQWGGTYDPEIRRRGEDWPSRAQTMIGLARLTQLRRATEDVLRRAVPGDLIETGVWRGGACILMRAVLAAYGDTTRRVWVADSFAGVPPPDANSYPADRGDQLHTHAQLAVSERMVRDNFVHYGLLDDQVRFLSGWFKDTLRDVPIERLAILRVDGDLSQSTTESLASLYPKLSSGGYVIIDDFTIIPACLKAVIDFRKQHAIDTPLIPIDRCGIYWIKE